MAAKYIVLKGNHVNDPSKEVKAINLQNKDAVFKLGYKLRGTSSLQVSEQ